MSRIRAFVPLILVVAMGLGMAWIEHNRNEKEVKVMRDIDAIEKARQYADWGSFDFAWFPINTETNQILSHDVDGHRVPVGFLSQEEGQAWIDKNRAEQHVFIKIDRDDLMQGWGIYVKVVYNVSPEWEITD